MKRKKYTMSDAALAARKKGAKANSKNKDMVLRSKVWFLSEQGYSPLQIALFIDRSLTRVHDLLKEKRA